MIEGPPIKLNDQGGTVFPAYQNTNRVPCGTDQIMPIGGMTLRQWYAGMALQAIGPLSPSYEKGPCNKAAVERAFVIADLMIEQGNK